MEQNIVKGSSIRRWASLEGTLLRLLYPLCFIPVHPDLQSMDLPGAPPLFSAGSVSEANTVLQDRPEAAEDVASCQLVPMLGSSSSLLVTEAPHAGVFSAGAARLLPRHPAALAWLTQLPEGRLDQGLGG